MVRMFDAVVSTSKRGYRHAKDKYRTVKQRVSAWMTWSKSPDFQEAKQFAWHLTNKSRYVLFMNDHDDLLDQTYT